MAHGTCQWQPHYMTLHAPPHTIRTCMRSIHMHTNTVQYVRRRCMPYTKLCHHTVSYTLTRQHHMLAAHPQQKV